MPVIKPFIMKLKREHDTFYKNNYKLVLSRDQRKCYYKNREEQELFLQVAEEDLKERTYLTPYQMKRRQQIYYENHYERLRTILEYICEHPDMDLSAEFEFDTEELYIKLFAKFHESISLP